VPLWTVVPGGEDFQAHDWHVTAHDEIANHAVSLVPAGAVVSLLAAVVPSSVPQVALPAAANFFPPINSPRRGLKKPSRSFMR